MNHISYLTPQIACAKLDVLAGVILSTFLLLILFGSMISEGASPRFSISVLSTGSINYWPQVDIDLNYRKVIGVNNLSLGFMIDHEWKSWRDNSASRELARNAGFRIVRFCDWRDSSHSPHPCTYWNESERTGTFNWTDVDLLVNRIFEIGAEPLITLGCYVGSKDYAPIPTGMAINRVTSLPYPESFAAYATDWVEHFKVVGLPVRFYEVFNEPFFYFYKDWNFNETKLSYFFELFNAAYTEMHGANSRILVGNDASLYRVFLDYWVQRGGKLDFLSFHKYDSNGLDDSSAIGLQRADQRYFVTNGIWYGIDDARRLWFEANSDILPAINSESNFSAEWKNGTDPRIQQMVGAVWTALTLRGCILNNIQYSIYYSFQSSLSWQRANTQSDGYGFGMVNSDNEQPWYPYYVQHMVGSNLELGDLLVETTSSSDEVRSLAWVHNMTLNVLLISKVDCPRIIHLRGIEGDLSMIKIDNNISWEAPKVQTYIIRSTEPMLMYGYTVALLQITTMP